MIKRFLNRLIFIIPFLLLGISWAISLDSLTNLSRVDFVLFSFLTIAFGWLLYEIYNVISFYNFRKNQVKNNILIKYQTKNPITENYFNLKITNNENEFQIFDKNEIILYYKEKSPYLEIITSIKNEKIKVSEIEFAVYEFYKTHLFLWSRHNYGKREWTNNFYLKLKTNRKLIKIATMQSNRDNLKEQYEYQSIDNDSYYFNRGCEIVNLICANLKLDYITINHLSK